MIGPFGFEVMEQYTAKHNTLLAPEICMCADCVAAGIALPSILSFEQKQRAEVDGKIREVHMGRWLHGVERKIHEERRAEAHAALGKMALVPVGGGLHKLEVKGDAEGETGARTGKR